MICANSTYEIYCVKLGIFAKLAHLYWREAFVLASQEVGLSVALTRISFYAELMLL
jgi:hypothetical protein